MGKYDDMLRAYRERQNGGQNQQEQPQQQVSTGDKYRDMLADYRNRQEQQQNSAFDSYLKQLGDKVTSTTSAYEEYRKKLDSLPAFDDPYAGYAVDPVSVANMSTGGSKKTNDELGRLYKEMTEAKNAQQEARNYQNYTTKLQSFGGDSEKMFQDYADRIKEIESTYRTQPDKWREASEQVKALEQERDSLKDYEDSLKKSQANAELVDSWAKGHGGTYESYQLAQQNYDELNRLVTQLQNELMVSGGAEQDYSGWATDEMSAAAIANRPAAKGNSKELQAQLEQAIREREQAKTILQYAQAHQADELNKAPDFELKAASGEEKFNAFKQEQQQELNTIETNPFAPSTVSRYDPTYHSDYREPDERWSEEEKKNFYYLYADEATRQQAYDYGISIDQKYNRGEAEARDWSTREFATRNFGTGAMASAASVPANLIGGAIDYGRMFAENAARGGIYETQYDGLSRWADTTRGAISEKLNESGTISKDVPVLGGKGLGDLYQLMMSMADSSVAVLAGGGAANAVFFGSAAASTTRDALERGISGNRAVAMGFAAGAAEVAGETLSVEHLLKQGDIADYLRHGLLREMAKQGGVEASEEVLTSILNMMADAVINGDQAELQQKVYVNVANGMAYDEAVRQASKEWLEELGTDALGGFLSGGLMSGGRLALQSGAAAVTKYQGDTQGLISMAGATEEGSRARDLAARYQQRYDKKGSLTNLQAAKLQAETQADINKADRPKLLQAAEERLRDQSTTTLHSDEYKRMAEGIVDRVMEGGEGKFSTALEQNVYEEMQMQLGDVSVPTGNWLDTKSLKKTQAEEIASQRLQSVETKDGARANIKNATMKDGELQLTIEENGEPKTMSQDDLKLDDYQKRTLQTLTQILGDDAAAAFNQMTSGSRYGRASTVTEYATAFATIRDLFGRATDTEKAEKAALASTLRQGLTDTQVRYAIAIGQQRAKENPDDGHRTARGTGKVSFEGGTLKDGTALKGVKDVETVKRSKQYRAVKAIAKALGIDVVLFESEADMDGNLSGAQGAYQDGVVYLDWNAGMNNTKDVGERMLLRTMSHELTHFIQENSPKDYADLKAFITKRLTDKVGRRFNDLVNQKMDAQPGLSYDEAVDEVIADSCETMLRDSQAVQELMQEHKSLWQSIRDFVKKFLKRITAQYDGAILLQDSIDELREIWDLGLRNAVESRTDTETGSKKAAEGGEKTTQFKARDNEWQAEINATMTMDQAKRMVQKAFVAAGIMEWYDGEYKNGDEWLKGEGASEVSDYIENDGDLYRLYIARNNHLVEYDFTIKDVLDAYLAGTLTGKQRTAPEKTDLQSGTGYQDSRFYSNTRGKAVDVTTWDRANSRVTNANAADVNRARLDILLAAHNGDLAKELGINASELNKKLRSWSRYSAAAMDASKRINAGVAEENRWTGIQNSSILSRMNMTDADIRSMVKGVTGESEQYQRNYIGNTMLALDTHIDWSWLSFEFKRGPAQVNDKTVAGYYENIARHIVVGGNSWNQERTVAHEMGHALDYQWERELFGGKSSQPLTENTFSESRIVDDDGRKFYKNFRSFMDGIMDSGAIHSSYFMEQKETFARFVARFVEWTQELAGANYIRNEHDLYGDKFTTAQFLEFARLLQQKAAWDVKQSASRKNTQLSARSTQTAEEVEAEAEEMSDARTQFSVRQGPPPKKTMIGYKVFMADKKHPGQLYPTKVKNPGGQGTPVGVWLDADTGEIARNPDGSIKTNTRGRISVKANGGSLAWRPGWHLGSLPEANQMNRVDPKNPESDNSNRGTTGLMWDNYIFCECEFAADEDYQLEAFEFGTDEKGRYNHSQAGLPYIPKDGYYKYRTNPDPSTAPWFISGSIRITKILDDDMRREIIEQWNAEHPDQQMRFTERYSGKPINLADYGLKAGPVAATEDLSSVAPGVDYSDEIRNLPGYTRHALNFDDPNVQEAFRIQQIEDRKDYYIDKYNREHRGELENGSKKAATTGGGVQFSLRDLNIDRKYIKHGDVYAEDAAVRDTVNSLIAREKFVNISARDAAEFNGIDYSDYKVARNAFSKILERFLGETIRMTHGGQMAEVYLTRRGLNHAAVTEYTPGKAAVYKKLRKMITNAEYSYSSVDDPHAETRPKGEAYWDAFVSVARFGKYIFPTVIKFRSLDRDIRSQIYNIASKREEIGSSHSPGLNNQGGLPNYGVTPISDNSIGQDTEEVKGQFSMRGGTKTDTQMLRDLYDRIESKVEKRAEKNEAGLNKAYQKMVRDKQGVIYDLQEEQRKALEKFHELSERYYEKEREVSAALQDLDRLVQHSGSREEIQRQRAKVSAKEEQMAKALERLTQAKGGSEIQEILRQEREIQMQRTQDRIRDSIDRRDLRKRISKLWKDLNQKVTSPSEKKRIPVELMQQTLDVLEAINMDTSREGSKTGEKLRAKLDSLRARYEELKNDPDFRRAAVYDAQVAEYLTNMIAQVGDTPINKMSVAQLETVYSTLQAMVHTASRALKLKLGEQELEAYEVSKAMTRETRSVEKPKTGFLSTWLNAQLSPERMFNRLGGYSKDSYWGKVYGMLNEGQLKQTRLQMEGSLIFEDLMEKENEKNFQKLLDPKNTVDIGLKDENGEPVLITHGMMISLYMHLQNDQNIRHIAYGGLTIPALQDYYNGKKVRGSERATRVGGALQEIAEINDRLHETEDADEIAELEQQRDEAALRAMDFVEGLREEIDKQLTDYDRQWIAASKELFDGFSKRELNRTTLEVYGIKRANVENYYPIWVDGDFLNTPFETVAKDMSLENAGFMKERVDSSKPIRLADVTDVTSSQIRKVAQYCGLMPAIRGFNKVWGKTQTGYRDSLQKAVHETFGQAGVKYVENLMADLNGARGGQDSALGEFLNRMRGHMAQASLTLSLRVAMGQTASYPTAAAVVGWGPLMKALAHGGRNNTIISRADQELIRKWSPLLYYRMKGYSTTELGDIAGMNDKFSRLWKKARWLTGWIQAMDGATVGRLWYAAEYYVQDHNKALAKGTDAYYEAVAKVFNDIVEKTQPDYTTMQRPDILRNPNALVKQLTMFLTQRLQNFNILYDAAATYSKYKADFKAGRNGVTTDDVRQAGIATRRAAISQVVAAATITGFKFLADAILHSMNNYRDDDDEELKAESISQEILDMFIDSLAGNVLGGGEIWDIVESKVFGKTYYGIEVSGLATVMDMVDAFSSTFDHVLKAAKDDEYEYGKEQILKDVDKLARNICTVAGIPYANGKKIAIGLYHHAIDIRNGAFLSYEAGVERSNAQQASRLYRAYTNGDGAKVKQILEEVPEDKQKDVYSAVRKLIREQQNSGELNVYEAMRQMKNYGGATDQVMAEYIKDLYEAGALPKADAEKYLQEYAGKTKETAAKTVTNVDGKQASGVNYNDIDDLFKIGRMNAEEARKALVNYGIDKDTADMKVEYWSYQQKNPGTAMTTEDRFETYWKKYRPVGMTPAMYDGFYVDWNAVQGTDKNHDGKADSGSKKAERIAIIDSLPLSPEQKDEIFLMNWAASGLQDAPWNK